jgi:hypothetical protein
MSENDERRRVPTSDELEQMGALAPSVERARDEPRRGGLRRFLRVGRIRVSADVAARKHIGVPPRSAVSSSDQPAQTSSPSQGPAAPTPEIPEVPTPRQAPDAIIPRPIRMDQSVRDRRGLGRSGKTE